MAATCFTLDESESDEDVIGQSSLPSICCVTNTQPGQLLLSTHSDTQFEPKDTHPVSDSDSSPPKQIEPPSKRGKTHKTGPAKEPTVINGCEWWQCPLLDILFTRRQALGDPLRPLRVASAFTGLGVDDLSCEALWHYGQ